MVLKKKKTTKTKTMKAKKTTKTKKTSNQSSSSSRVEFSNGVSAKALKSKERITKWYDDLVGKVTRTLGDSKKLNSVINNLNKSRDTALKAF